MGLLTYIGRLNVQPREENETLWDVNWSSLKKKRTKRTPCSNTLQKHWIKPSQGDFSFCFLGPHPWHMELPRLGVKSELHLPAYTTQCQIQATSATYTTAHGNTGPLTHWVRPGIESTTSWFLAGFINRWATKGTPSHEGNSPDGYCYLISENFNRWGYPVVLPEGDGVGKVSKDH